MYLPSQSSTTWPWSDTDCPAWPGLSTCSDVLYFICTCANRGERKAGSDGVRSWDGWGGGGVDWYLAFRQTDRQGMVERDRRTINSTEYFILSGLRKLCIFLDTKFSKCRYRAEQNLLDGAPRRVRGGADAPPRRRFSWFRVASKSSGPVCFIVYFHIQIQSYRNDPWTVLTRA